LVVVVVEAAAAAADAMHGVHPATTVVSTESISIPLLYPSVIRMLASYRFSCLAMSRIRGDPLLT
jgi:hypothetical protein